MSSDLSPWVKQLRAVTDLKHLNNRVTFVPEERICRTKLNEFNAAVIVRRALSKCYVPGESSMAAIAKILSLALDNCMEQFPSAHGFSLRVNSVNFSAQPAPVVCLTGLAGVGKSAVFDAIQRLVGSLPVIAISQHGKAEHLPISRIQVHDRWGVKEMAKHFGLPETGSNIARALYRRGCCLIALDELQFISTSAQANTRASKLIYSTSLYGPTLVYACNFSLGHKLKKRPHEERDRILSSPIVISPDLAESPAWKERVRVWSTIIDDLLDSPLTDRSEDLWELVVGINRSAISLIALSSALAVANKSKLKWDHIEAAYKSAPFSNIRDDIAGIRLQSIERDMSRLDLVCPFESAGAADYLDVVKKMRRSRYSETAGIEAQTRRVRLDARKETHKGAERSKRTLKPVNAAELMQDADEFRDEVRLGRRR